MELADLLAAPDRGADAHKQAAEHYDRQCVMGHRGVACVRAARLHLKGDGVPHDAQKALDILGFACGEEGKDADACLLRGDLAARAPEVAADMPTERLILEGLESARRWYGEACRLGSDEACTKLAALNKRPR
jgi:TPR repeat protein